MGFSFNLFFIFILIPLTIILLIGWLLTKKKIFGLTTGIIWLGIFGLTIVTQIMMRLNAPVSINKKDYYGTYVINRNYFRGYQADWQYESFRFEIKDNDSIYFHIINKAKILKTYKGKISTIEDRNYERLVIEMDAPSHHILADNPIISRKAWDFQLIFYSPKFHNVFFKKDEWEPINNKKSGTISSRPAPDN